MMAIEGRISTNEMAKESSDRLELLQGTLDMLILKTLLFGGAHGHQLANHIQRTTDDVLQVEHGSLYPALHRLEREGRMSVPAIGATRSIAAIVTLGQASLKTDIRMVR
jgi:DNA-binding PadR family transcriptional regulator